MESSISWASGGCPEKSSWSGAAGNGSFFIVNEVRPGWIAFGAIATATLKKTATKASAWPYLISKQTDGETIWISQPTE